MPTIFNLISRAGPREYSQPAQTVQIQQTPVNVAPQKPRESRIPFPDGYEVLGASFQRPDGDRVTADLIRDPQNQVHLLALNVQDRQTALQVRLRRDDFHGDSISIGDPATEQPQRVVLQEGSMGANYYYTAAPIWAQGPTQPLPPQVGELLQQAFGITASTTVEVVPDIDARLQSILAGYDDGNRPTDIPTMLQQIPGAYSQSTTTQDVGRATGSTAMPDPDFVSRMVAHALAQPSSQRLTRHNQALDMVAQHYRGLNASEQIQFTQYWRQRGGYTSLVPNRTPVDALSPDLREDVYQRLQGNQVKLTGRTLDAALADFQRQHALHPADGKLTAQTLCQLDMGDPVKWDNVVAHLQKQVRARGSAQGLLPHQRVALQKVQELMTPDQQQQLLRTWNNG